MNRLLPLILLLFFTSTIADRCPQQCSCNIVPRSPDQLDYFYTSVDCKQTLNDSDTLPENVNKLTVRDVKVNVTRLLYSVRAKLKAAPYLAEIHLKNLSVVDCCGGESIRVSALDPIRLFVLSECVAVARVPILNVTSLKSLHLVGNSLRVIPARVFANVPSLEELNLSANEISNVEVGAFEGLPKLLCLDLSRNNLTDLHGGVFTSLQSLQHLNLSGNFLRVLREDSLDKLVGLQQLDISWNRLVSVPPGSLELPYLNRLLLSGNMDLGGGKETNRLLVGNGRQLQTIDASHTGLKQVPIALTHSIRTLQLTENAISTINSGEMDSYPLLQLLDLTNNTLVMIEDDALGRLDYLTVLYLRRNQLISIPKSLPVHLKILHLENNNIQKLSMHDFCGLTQLEVLLLNDNKVNIVENNVFTDLTNLETLDLSNNPIKTLGIISGPRELRVLRLAQLNALLSAAKETAFPVSVPDYLITLDLSGSIYLAKQLLADTAALAAARQLQELNLADTGVDSIRSDLLHYLSQLRTLHLEGNPLNCSQLQWLAEWMRRQEAESYRRVQCSAPPEMKGSLLVDLQYIQEVVTTTTAMTTVTTATVVPNKDSINLANSSKIIETAFPRNKFNNNSMLRSTAVAPAGDKSAGVDAEEAIFPTQKNNTSKVVTNSSATLEVDKISDNTWSTYKLSPTVEYTDSRWAPDYDHKKTTVSTTTNQTASGSGSVSLKHETQSQNDILKLPPHPQQQQQQQQERELTELLPKQRRRKVVNKQTQLDNKLAAPLPALRLSYVSNYQDGGVGAPAALQSESSVAHHHHQQQSLHVTASSGLPAAGANLPDNNANTASYHVAHPSMLIVVLVVAVATAIAILAVITTLTRMHQRRLRSRRRRPSGNGSFTSGEWNPRERGKFEEIEVTTLPSVTELW